MSALHIFGGDSPVLAEGVATVSAEQRRGTVWGLQRADVLCVVGLPR